MQLLVSEGIKRGYIRPLSRVVYSPLEVSRAFRLVAASRHCGRALLQLQAQVEKVVGINPELRLHCNANTSHVILCNNDYLGLRIAERLAKRGARKIYLHGLRQSAYVDFELESLRNFGVQVKICNDLLKSENDINTLINNSMHLGSVEGVYFIATDEENLSRFNVLQILDLVTRKLCPHLRYFGIIGSNASYCNNICITRSKDNFPVTNIILPPIEKMNAAHKTCENFISEIDAINLFEVAIKSNESVLLAYVHLKKYQSLFKEITRIAGVKAPDEVVETATLSDLNIGSDKLKIIVRFLRNVHNIPLLDEDISNMTIQRLNEIQETMTNFEYESTKGLSTFYSYVEPDELTLTTEMLFLPTLVNSSEMRYDEFDATETYLCIIPGLEGHYGRFRTLCERLKLPAIVLQPGLDQPNESVPDLAKRYTEILMKKTALKQNFYLMGYESGALVALEMAVVLEKQGLTGTIFCLGESPDKFHITLNKELEKYNNDETLQAAVAKHMIYLMLGVNTNELEKELSKEATWPEKIEACVSSVLGKISHSAQYVRQLIMCAYGRIKQVQAYRPTPLALHSKLILINAAGSAGSFEPNIQSYSQLPVSVYQLKAPLTYSAMDLRCTSIINSHLDAKVVENFNKKNLCDSYLLNADTFITAPSNYE